VMFWKRGIDRICMDCSKSVSAEAAPARKSKSSEALIGEGRVMVESRVRQP
jgi:hypothetical protein